MTSFTNQDTSPRNAPIREHAEPATQVVASDTTTAFSELGLIEALQRAVHDAGYEHPTPIQVQAIPHVIAGRDLLGCARTGTGKTAAFALPILQRLAGIVQRTQTHGVRALVLVPTRELAAQVAESFQKYGARLKLSVAVIYGGVSQGPQVRALQRGVDVVVATPGRLVDLMGQGHARLDRVEILVLDEADHMLDLGFIPDVRKILAKLPKRRQTLFFSATMPPEISKLADTMLVQPTKVYVTPAATTVEQVEQRVFFVEQSGKPALIARVLAEPDVERALVFTRTKRGADRVARRLAQDGIPAEAIHGNKSQNARERTLGGFRHGKIRVLVATDIAARGIDVDGITHVVNYELPNVPETYVHRIGRTARAGASGIAISLCDSIERAYLRDIERLIGRKVPVVGRAAGEHHDAARVERPARAGQGAPTRHHAAASHRAAHASQPRRGGHAPERSHAARRHAGSSASRPHAPKHGHAQREHGARPHARGAHAGPRTTPHHRPHAAPAASAHRTKHAEATRASTNTFGRGV